MSSPGSGETSLGLQLMLWVTAVGGTILFVLGLGYRLWRWMNSPDEKTARKQEARRERLRRAVRRPAQEVPIHEGLLAPRELPDPALNDEVRE